MRGGVVPTVKNPNAYRCPAVFDHEDDSEREYPVLLATHRVVSLAMEATNVRSPLVASEYTPTLHRVSPDPAVLLYALIVLIVSVFAAVKYVSESVWDAIDWIADRISRGEVASPVVNAKASARL
jgi:hypothetical protein